MPPRHLLHFRHRRQRVVALTTMLPRPLQLPAAAAAQPRRRRRRHRDAAAPPRRHAPCPHRLLPTCYLRRNRQRVARHRHRHCHRHRCPRDRGPHSGSYCQHPPGSVRRLLRAATAIAAPSQFILRQCVRCGGVGPARRLWTSRKAKTFGFFAPAAHLGWWRDRWACWDDRGSRYWAQTDRRPLPAACATFSTVSHVRTRV